MRIEEMAGKRIYKYLKYVLRHKYYVGVECFKKGLFLQGLFHDISKLRPDEFFPYANHFWGSKEKIDKYKKIARTKTGYAKGMDTGDNLFDIAWLKHIHRNPHHWQYWILIQDEDEDKVFPMPKRYLLEMLADWRGAGKAQGRKHKSELQDWYSAHKDKMKLHWITKIEIEEGLFGETES